MVSQNSSVKMALIIFEFCWVPNLNPTQNPETLGQRLKFSTQNLVRNPWFWVWVKKNIPMPIPGRKP